MVELLKKLLVRVIPVGFIVGFGMELFMVKTGFYEIVTTLEGIRKAELNADMAAKAKRLQDKGINIKFVPDP